MSDLPYDKRITTREAVRFVLNWTVVFLLMVIASYGASHFITIADANLGAETAQGDAFIPDEIILIAASVFNLVALAVAAYGQWRLLYPEWGRPTFVKWFLLTYLLVLVLIILYFLSTWEPELIRPAQPVPRIDTVWNGDVPSSLIFSLVTGIGYCLALRSMSWWGSGGYLIGSLIGALVLALIFEPLFGVRFHHIQAGTIGVTWPNHLFEHLLFALVGGALPAIGLVIGLGIAARQPASTVWD